MTGQPDARQAPVGRPPKAGRAKVAPELLAFLRGGMLIVAGMIFVVGLLLLILPTFRVKTIEVEGNSVHSAEEIIAASGIVVGQEILSIDKNEVNLRIWENCNYIDEISIVSSFDSIRIVVTERQNVMYTEFDGTYVSLDRSFRVIEQSTDADRFSSFLYVTLPEIASLSVGSTVEFENDEVDRSYITELIDALAEDSILSSVTSLDFSKKYSVSYVMENACRVEVGKVSDMSAKLAMVSEILTLKGGVGAALSVIDVSNLQKPTYRVLSSADMLLGGLE